MPARGNIIPLHPEDQDNLEVALHWAKRGFAVFPCGPDKHPRVGGWKTRATTDLDQIRGWWRKWPDALVGLPCGARSGLAVLDIDCKKGKDGFAGLRAMGLDPDDLSPFVVKTPSGGLHVYFQWREGMGNSAAGLPPGCDVRGEGGYVIAAGSSGPLGRYRAIGKPLPHCRIGGPPEWPTALPLGPVGRKGAASGAAPCGVPLAVLRSALMAVPNDGSNPDTDSRDGWLGIGMALHHETEGSEAGRDLWHEWSAQWPGYNEGATEAAWASLTTGRKGAASRKWGSLRREAMHHGWTPPEDDPLRQAERARQLARFDCIPEGPAPRPDPITEEINRTYALVYHEGKTLVAKTAGDKLALGSVQDLHNLFANWQVRTGKGDQTRPASYTWLESEHRRTYAGGIDFDPTGRDRKGVLNLWKGWATKPDPKASCDLILDHVRDVICAGNADHAAYVLGWGAHLVQRPGEKPGVALVLRGPKGAGKDTLAVILSKIIGQRHVAHVTRPEALTDRFNAPFATAMLGHVEEAYWAGDPSKKGALQALIT
ncbi:MAG: bifunctional DNA primase/polymerase, partial [Roseinatronobacter sp.]